MILDSRAFISIVVFWIVISWGLYHLIKLIVKNCKGHKKTGKWLMFDRILALFFAVCIPLGILVILSGIIVLIQENFEKILSWCVGFLSKEVKW